MCHDAGLVAATTELEAPVDAHPRFPLSQYIVHMNEVVTSLGLSLGRQSTTEDSRYAAKLCESCNWRAPVANEVLSVEEATEEQRVVSGMLLVRQMVFSRKLCVLLRCVWLAF